MHYPLPRQCGRAGVIAAVRTTHHWLTHVGLAAFLLATVSLPAAAQAGLQSGPANVTVNVNKHASLTLTVTSGATQTLANVSDGTVNPFPAPVTFVTTWDVHPQTAGFQVVASFASASSALVNEDGTEAIPSSLIEGSVPGGVPVGFTPFTQSVTGGAANAGLVLVNQAITPPTRRGSRTDELSLRLNLTGAEPLTVGEYSGVLTLRAITQ